MSRVVRCQSRLAAFAFKAILNRLLNYPRQNTQGAGHHVSPPGQTISCARVEVLTDGTRVLRLTENDAAIADDPALPDRLLDVNAGQRAAFIAALLDARTSSDDGLTVTDDDNS
jgi:hypothetical protein